MERNNEQQWQPLHLAKCFGELALFYAQEKVKAFQAMVDDAMDIDFGDLED